MKKMLLFAALCGSFYSNAQTTYYPDSCYGLNGINIVPARGIKQWMNGIAPTADGKVVILSSPANTYSSFYISRLLPDGTADISFNNTGWEPAPITDINSAPIVTDSTGNIFVASHQLTGISNYMQVAKIQPNGQPAIGFGNSSGIALFRFPNLWNLCYGMGLQADGKILVTGSVTVSGGSYSVSVWRLQSNGQPDSSFAQNGGLVNPFVPLQQLTNTTGYAIAQLPNGKILVAGRTEDYNTSGAGLGMFAFRLKANGSTDSSFGTNGLITLHNTDNYYWDPTAIHIDAAGNAYVVAHYGNWSPPTAANFLMSPSVTKITAAGQIDLSYGTNGTAIVDSLHGGSEGMKYNIASSYDAVHNKILVMGTIEPLYYSTGIYYDTAVIRYAVARLTAQGQPDATFHNNKSIYAISRGFKKDAAISGALMPDGKIVLAGYGTLNNTDDTSRLVLIRISDHLIPTPQAAFTKTTLTANSFKFNYTGSATIDSATWDFGDNSPAVSGQIVNHTYTASGTYNVCVTAHNECHSDQVCQSVVVSSVSVESVHIPVINLYPNPATEDLCISGAAAGTMLELYDMQGRKILTGEISKKSYILPVGKLVSGVYLLKFTSKEGIHFNRQLVKQ